MLRSITIAIADSYKTWDLGAAPIAAITKMMKRCDTGWELVGGV